METEPTTGSGRSRSRYKMSAKIRMICVYIKLCDEIRAAFEICSHSKRFVDIVLMTALTDGSCDPRKFSYRLRLMLNRVLECHCCTSAHPAGQIYREPKKGTTNRSVSEGRAMCVACGPVLWRTRGLDILVFCRARSLIRRNWKRPPIIITHSVERLFNYFFRANPTCASVISI